MRPARRFLARGIAGGLFQRPAVGGGPRRAGPVPDRPGGLGDLGRAPTAGAPGPERGRDRRARRSAARAGHDDAQSAGAAHPRAEPPVPRRPRLVRARFGRSPPPPPAATGCSRTSTRPGPGPRGAGWSPPATRPSGSTATSPATPWAELAETDPDRVPETAPTPAPAPPPTVAVAFRVPFGATVQVRQDLLVADGIVELPAGEAVPVVATFADHREIGCTLPAGGAREVALAGADGDGPSEASPARSAAGPTRAGGRSCGWRPGGWE